MLRQCSDPLALVQKTLGSGILFRREMTPAITNDPVRPRRRRNRSSALLFPAVAIGAMLALSRRSDLGPTATSAFVLPATSSSSSSTRHPTTFIAQSPTMHKSQKASTTSLHMFMGSDGGILGIGGPELATILLVGYFVLGPSDLYKLVKSIGSFVQNARTLTTDLTKTFESNMESQLQLEEIRKAQRELNDAFSFRRSINVDQTGDAFSTDVTTPREGWVEGQDLDSEGGVSTGSASDTATAAGTGDAGAAPRKKKLKRRRRVQLESPEEDDGAVADNLYGVPDLEMPGAMSSSSSSSLTEEEQATIDEEFERYTSMGDDAEPASAEVEAAAAEAEALAAQQRFQRQLSGNWNDQVLASEDVLTTVLQKLSLLEEEKAAATKRLEEEFERRSQLEETYYSRQREVLESALRQVEGRVVGTGAAAGATAADPAPNNSRKQ